VHANGCVLCLLVVLGVPAPIAGAVQIDDTPEFSQLLQKTQVIVLLVCVAVSVNRIEGLKPNVCVQCMGKWPGCHLDLWCQVCVSACAGDKQLQQGCAMCEEVS
jgi:hypothetical protein